MWWHPFESGCAHEHMSEEEEALEYALSSFVRANGQDDRRRGSRCTSPSEGSLSSYRAGDDEAVENGIVYICYINFVLALYSQMLETCQGPCRGDAARPVSFAYLLRMIGGGNVDRSTMDALLSYVQMVPLVENCAFFCPSRAYLCRNTEKNRLTHYDLAKYHFSDPSLNGGNGDTIQTEVEVPEKNILLENIAPNRNFSCAVFEEAGLSKIPVDKNNTKRQPTLRSDRRAPLTLINILPPLQFPTALPPSNHDAPKTINVNFVKCGQDHLSSLVSDTSKLGDEAQVSSLQPQTVSKAIVMDDTFFSTMGMEPFPLCAFEGGGSQRTE